MRLLDTLRRWLGIGPDPRDDRRVQLQAARQAAAVKRWSATMQEVKRVEELVLRK